MKVQIRHRVCQVPAAYANADQAIKAAGLDAELEKVEKIQEILAFGVMATPALAVDGKVSRRPPPLPMRSSASWVLAHRSSDAGRGLETRKPSTSSRACPRGVPGNSKRTHEHEHESHLPCGRCGGAGGCRRRRSGARRSPSTPRKPRKPSALTPELGSTDCTACKQMEPVLASLRKGYAGPPAGAVHRCLPGPQGSPGARHPTHPYPDLL